jgi:YD repeat-containing protein
MNQWIIWIQLKDTFILRDSFVVATQFKISISETVFISIDVPDRSPVLECLFEFVDGFVRASAFEFKATPTRELTYSGCACAGGDVSTVRDERGRRRLTNDVLGRLVKVEELNWDTSVYATTSYTYNARDQLTESNQAGQTRTMVYDDYGRMWKRITPEQGTTTYGYNADDTVQTVTDARTAVMTFGYNPRNLVTGITFSVPGGVVATPNVTFQYDAAGNRTNMSSRVSTVSYNYDTASRLTSEVRTLAGLSGSFTLGYDLTCWDQLTEITTPGNVKVGYSYNEVGDPGAVTGQGYGGVTSYASGLVHRAFGGLKQMNYANGRSLSLSYNNRMLLTQSML